MRRSFLRHRKPCTAFKHRPSAKDAQVQGNTKNGDAMSSSIHYTNSHGMGRETKVHSYRQASEIEFLEWFIWCSWTNSIKILVVQIPPPRIILLNNDRGNSSFILEYQLNLESILLRVQGTIEKKSHLMRFFNIVSGFTQSSFLNTRCPIIASIP